MGGDDRAVREHCVVCKVTIALCRAGIPGDRYDGLDLQVYPCSYNVLYLLVRDTQDLNVLVSAPNPRRNLTTTV